MKVYSYSQARQQLASLLDEALRKGVVKIRRRDGTVFEVTRVEESESGLDVPGVTAGVGTAEMLSIVRKGRAGTLAPRAVGGAGPSVSARGRSGGGRRSRGLRPQLRRRN